MQSVSVALAAELAKGQSDPVVLVDVLELYNSDYIPGVNGFDPADAIETFAGQTLTWDGIAYRREVISRGDIVRSMGEKTNSTTTEFSNISRYLATLATTQQIEGLLQVIRCVSPTVTDDSVVLFVGRCEKQSDVDKKKFTLPARQDFGNINQEVPPRLFTAEDPNGRSPSDLLYEGFRILPLAGDFSIPITTASTSFFGRLLGKKKTSNETRQWSSLDATPYGSVVPMHFGRVQVEGIHLFFSDIGYSLVDLVAWGEGRVDAITNVTIRDDRFTLATQRDAFGDPGGTLTNIFAVNPSDYPQGAINHGYLSKTAYTVVSIKGSAGDVVDEAPVITALIRGLRIPVPNSSGVYASSAWSDNPVNIARFLLTDPRLVGIDPGFMEDSVNYLTSLHCDEPLIDDSNGEVSLITSTDEPQGGTGIRRFPSTGIITPRYVLYYFLGDTSVIPEFLDNTYTPFDPTDIPTTFAIQRLLRKRYTASFPLTERQRSVDCLYKIAFPAFKGFLRVNKRGKYEIRSETSADATHLRAATTVGATAVLINDVIPWKTGPDLLTGCIRISDDPLISEVRNVSSADYSTAGNSVALAASATGGITATPSGANLSGGSITVQASGTVTIGGTPGTGDTASVEIDGIESVHTLNADDTTGTVAYILTALINANSRLQKYINATWLAASPTIITIKSKQGALNLDSALLKAHTGPIAEPTTTPVLASSAGALGAGTYELAYSDKTALGRTALSPVASINLAASKQIDVDPIALVGASRDWYMSVAPNSPYLKWVANTNGAAFSINALPLPGALMPPRFNTTGEELIRGAMAFATNSQDVFSVWPAATLVLLTDVYLPTVPNGHKYQVSTQGTTGASEPTWPTTAGGTVASGTAVFTEIGSTVLKQTGLTRANIIKDSFKWPLNRQSSVNQIKGNYRDANNDFALTPFKVNDRIHQAQVHKIYPLEVDLSAVDNWHQAFRLANWQLAKNREGDWFASWKTGPQGLVLEEGDVCFVSDDSGGLVNVAVRIEELRISPNHEVAITQARKYSTNMFADEVEADVIPVPTTLRYTQTAPSIIEFIDNFAIRDADSLVPGFYVAVSRDLSVLGDWRGWILYADYGDGYVEIARGDLPAIMGEATDTLDTATDATVFDTTSEVTFTLKYGPPTPFAAPFATVTEADLIANPRRNLFLVGNEYLQAATVVDNGSFSYTISDFYRGRFGTDGTELTHGASERVVFLDGSEQFVAISKTHAGIAYDYKAVTTNQNVADALPVSFTWTGGTITPLRPSSLTAQRDTSLDWAVWAIGHPRPSEVPESYTLRVRNPADDAILRDIPISLGGRYAAMFEEKFTDGTFTIVNNDVTLTPLPTVIGRGVARSIQQFSKDDEMLIEGKATVTGADSAIYIALASAWGGTFHYTPYVQFKISFWSSSVTRITYIDWGTGISLTEIIKSVSGGIMYFAIGVTGTEVRFYAANSGSPIAANEPPRFIGKINFDPSSDLKLILDLNAGVDGYVAAEDVMLAGFKRPQTIYALRQQQEDLGEDTLGVGLASVDLEMRQVSLYPGVEGAPVRAVFP